MHDATMICLLLSKWHVKRENEEFLGPMEDLTIERVSTAGK